MKFMMFRFFGRKGSNYLAGLSITTK